MHNPWPWSEPFGFVQAIELRNISRVLECSGQVSFAEDGATMHPGDMHAQLGAALDNLETVLAAADMDLGHVVKLTTYVTDMDAYMEHRQLVTDRAAAAGARYTHTLIGVQALARPDIVVELEAVAYA
jgi:enamine deaminase RidA (YjgF/YER057c/UK114 family)